MHPSDLLRPARTLLVVWLCAAFAGPRLITAESPRPSITPETILKAHRIPITRKAIFEALAGNDETVRGAAAEVALNRWPKDAIRPVERAMLKESDVYARIWMANDLFALGDPLGREMLVRVCHDMAEPGSARMGAANDLVRLKDDSCLESVFNTLESATDLRDTVAKEDALELAPELIRHFGPQRYQSVLQLVIRALGDSWPSNRTTASRVLAQIGDPAAIPSLEAAMTEEKDETRRSILLDSLQVLKMKNQAR